jgi:digeranylgeranylglycerophospholipid reductase
MKYDVVVVGAGPAGTVTARFAAESGAKVIIVERRQEIGVPVLCGEGVSRKIDQWNILEGKRWIASSMDGARIYSPDGTMVKLSADMAGNETGYVIYRDIFDQELAHQAVKAGTKIMMNTTATGLLKKNDKIKGVKVKQFDEEFEIEADIVVGADGVESNIGVGLKLDLTQRIWKHVLNILLQILNVKMHIVISTLEIILPQVGMSGFFQKVKMLQMLG